MRSVYGCAVGHKLTIRRHAPGGCSTPHPAARRLWRKTPSPSVQDGFGVFEVVASTLRAKVEAGIAHRERVRAVLEQAA